MYKEEHDKKLDPWNLFDKTPQDAIRGMPMTSLLVSLRKTIPPLVLRNPESKGKGIYAAAELASPSMPRWRIKP